MPQVIIEQPGVPPRTIPLSGKEVRFGRSEDSDVILVADEVSRHHAKMLMDGERTILVDLKSLNGTYVNRQRIVERVLSHMDEIWFGSKCRLVYRDDTHFGRDSKQERPESKLVRNMDKIRAEMDRVGNSMTMIGRSTPVVGTIISQQASAEATAEELVRMGRAYRRMASLHKTSQVMASEFDLNERLARVLDIVMEVMEADRGFVMLRDENTNSLNVKVAREMGKELAASSPSMGIAGRAAIDGEPVLMADRSTDQEFGMRDSIIMGQILSAMCVPLKIEDRILGSIYVDTRKSTVTFDEEDLELFASLANQSALAIDNVQLHQKMVESEKRRQNFGRFLPHGIVEMILNDDAEIELGGQKTSVSTMFCDIRGSTHLGEQLTAHQLVELLNEHFTAMTEIIFEYQGTLDKYIGDEIMAIFGAPLSMPDHDIKAVTAALTLQRRNEELNVLRRSEGKPEVNVGIGIDSGEVIAGYIGSPMRMDYTVVGDRVNTAKRFCDMAAAGKVVVGEATWQAIKDRVTSKPLGTVMLKGKENPVYAYEITGLA